LVILYILAWTGFLAWLLESLPDTPESVASAAFWGLYIGGLLPIVALGGLVFANVAIWRAGSGWFARLWGALAVVATAIVIWLAVANGFYSFDFSY
jgi:hypothetical protein